MNADPIPKPLVVVILDGWGISFVRPGNAIFAAYTPHMDTYARFYPSAAIAAGGIEVGLPWGEVGNSETGHSNIGAGQVRYQALPQIDKAISDQVFFENPALKDAVDHAKAHKSRLHLMGLASPGGVHAHINHLFALLEMCKREKFRDNVYIHIFTDGRDTPPQSALTYLASLEEQIKKYGIGTIASLTGRFYAMDRNNNWDRTAATYNMLTGGDRTNGAPSAKQAIDELYAQNITDEKIPPTAITHGGEGIGSIQDNDAVIFFNFRPDRARQITQAFTDPAATGAPIKPVQNLYFCTMTEYDEKLPAEAAFTDRRDSYPLAQVISEANLTQLHIAETEKYAHVTYYLNVGREKPFPGENRVMIPSSAAEDFADEPHMQAEGIADEVVSSIEQEKYDVYFVNFANADMVGHTSNFQAAVEACGFVDVCLGRIEAAVFQKGGAMLITADHGNAEEMTNPETGAPEKDHTSNPVPLHYVAARLKRTTPKSDQEMIGIFSAPIGVLADVAPTVLDILHLPQPPLMTGVSLFSSLR